MGMCQVPPDRGTEPGQRPSGHCLESRGATGVGGGVPRRGGRRAERHLEGARLFLQHPWVRVWGSSEMAARMSQHRKDLSGV